MEACFGGFGKMATRKRNRRPTHPGVVFKLDVLDPLGITITQAASALGVSRKHLSNIVNGKASVSRNLAQRIAAVTDTSAESWLNMQLTYDVWEIENSPAPDVTPLEEIQCA